MYHNNNVPAKHFSSAMFMGLRTEMMMDTPNTQALSEDSKQIAEMVTLHSKKVWQGKMLGNMVNKQFFKPSISILQLTYTL